MNDGDVRAALRALGILAPSRNLVENCLRAAQAAEMLPEERRLAIQPSPTEPNANGSYGGGAVADTLISAEDLDAAIRALEAEGLPTTHQAVLDWLAKRRPSEQQPPTPRMSQPERPSQKKGSSKLARFVAHSAGAAGTRKSGRPLTITSWFLAVAETMADGTTLRTALAIHGLTLSANEIRSLYRNKTFKGLYQEARRRYLIENWGRSGPSLRAILGRCI